MQEVRSEKSRTFVWPGVHAETGENARVLSRPTRKAFVLTDRHCIEIARRVGLSLQQSHFVALGGALPPGRGRPSPAALQQIDERLNRLGTDSTCIVAVGGTPIMHLGSALASRFAGGLPLFLVPTSLRAQLDSSVGGASCCPIGGRWHPPLAVFSDPTVLVTLPLRDYLAGMAEAVKFALIADGQLIPFLQENQVAIRDRSPGPLEELTYRCANSKAAALDASPEALRALEYGHVVGRALERIGGAAILHGEALAVGMEAEAFLARGLGWADQELPAVQNRLLKAFGLPTRVRGLSPELLLKALQGREFVLPDLPGHPRGRVKPPLDLLKAAIQAVTR